MLRLTGLPHVARYPEATVTRNADHLRIVFGGLGREQAMSVPTRYVGGDEEEAELRLLAQLQELGYRVERAPPQLG